MAFRIAMMLVCLTLTWGVVGCGGGQGTVEFPKEKLDEVPKESAIDAFKAPAVSEDPSKE
jgi:hypothetical protein